MPDQLEDIEFKAAPAGQVAVNNSKGIVECFVAGIGNKDSVGDIVTSGAFNGSLKRRKPRVVWGHNWNDPIGKVLEIYEVPASDSRLPEKMKRAGIGGLYAKVQFNLNSEKGREAFANVQFFGLEQEWSIGYKTLDAVFDPAKQANVLKEVELYEVSPVLHGANQLTGTISIKGAKKPLKDPKGGLTAAGREHFKRTEGANLKPGVKGPANTPQKMRRKGSFLTRFFTNPSGPMQKPDGKPTRLALSAAAWGEPVPKNRSDAAKLAAKGRRLLERYENSKEKSADWDEDEFFEWEEYFAEEFEEPAEVKDAFSDDWDDLFDLEFDDQDPEEKGHWMMRMAAPKKPEASRDIFAEGEATSLSPEKRNMLEMEIASRVQAPIKVMSATENLVVFAKKKPDGSKKFYRLPYHWDQEERQYMFGKPERVVPQVQMTFRRMKPTIHAPQVKPSETTSQAYVGPAPEPTMQTVHQAREKDEDDQEKSLDYMLSLSGFQEPEDDRTIMIECEAKDAFYVKNELDPLFEYHNVDVEVTESGIKVLSGATEEFLDAVAIASKSLMGGGQKKALRSLRRVSARFDPNAIDGDEDGLVQEGTPFERPAVPRAPKKPDPGRMQPRQTSGEMQSRRGGHELGGRVRENAPSSVMQATSPEQLQRALRFAIEDVTEKREEMAEKYGKYYEKLWGIHNAKGHSLTKDASLEELAWAVVSRDGSGYDDAKLNAEVDYLTKTYRRFEKDLDDLDQIEANAISIRDWIEERYESFSALEERIKQAREEIDSESEIVNRYARTMRMTESEWEDITNSSDPEKAADKWLSDNFDEEVIAREDLASSIQEMLYSQEQVEDLEWEIQQSQRDLDEFKKFFGSLDEAKEMAFGENTDILGLQPPQKAPKLDAVVRGLDNYRRFLGEDNRGMASRRKARDGMIEIMAPVRDLDRYSNSLRDAADDYDLEMNRTTRGMLKKLADSLEPNSEGSTIDKNSLQEMIDTLNMIGPEDETGELLDVADFLVRAKIGQRNGRWTDGRVDSETQKLNDFGTGSDVQIRQDALSLKLNEDERGDLRRAFESNKESIQGIAGIAEYDKWLQSGSDRMDAEVANRIRNGLNQYAERIQNRSPDPVIVAGKDVIDLAALDPKGSYASPKKAGGFESRRPLPPGMTKRNMSDLLTWGQNEASPTVRERFAGRQINDVSPKGWAILDGARGMRSERDGTPKFEDRDLGQKKQRGRQVGTEQVEERFKGTNWSEIKPDNWDQMSPSEQFDNLFEFYSPKKSGMRQVDFDRLVAEVSKKIDREERMRERQERRRRFAPAGNDGTTEERRQRAENQTQTSPERRESQPQMSREEMDAAFAEQRARDLKKIDRRVAGASSRVADAIADGEADDRHRELWDSVADIANESDDLTTTGIEAMRDTLEEYIEEFRGQDLTRDESRSVQSATTLRNLLDDMAEQYASDRRIQRGDSVAATAVGGADPENDIPNSGVDAARLLAEGGMRSTRNYKPSEAVQRYFDARQSDKPDGLRSEREPRAQIVGEAAFFKEVKDSLVKEIAKATSKDDTRTADALKLLDAIMTRQKASGPQRGAIQGPNTGRVTATQEEIDDIMDALMIVVDRQQQTDGSKLNLFSKLIDMFAEAAMSTFVTGETPPVYETRQTRTNEAGKPVKIPNV